MDFKIPKQLMNMQFCRVRYKTKKPFEKDWTNKPYTYEEISKYFPKENYGILTGVNRLGVLDDDTENKVLIKLFEKAFGDTYKVREHEYVFLKGWNGQKIIFYDGEGKHCGELQGKGQMVVGAGSVHTSGEIYEIKNNIQIKEIDTEIFKSIFQEYIPKLKSPTIKDLAMVKTNWEGEDIKDIPITNIISLVGLSDMGSGCYQGSHIVHGSSGGMNFRVDTVNNTWYCFRCSSGGSSPELIAVVEGIINCSEAGRGCLAGDKGSQVIRLARDKYGLKTPDIKKEPMGWACSINIKKMAERYNLLNCPKCNLPFLFNVSGFYKCKSCGMFGGLKKFANLILQNQTQLNLQEVINMPSIKDQAKAYEPVKTKNIAELDKVSVDIEIREETFNEGTKEEFNMNLITVNKEDYRVPDSVLKNLKAILEEKPELKNFKVVKTGEGLKTTYTVVTLD